MKLSLETAKALQPGERIKDHLPATKGLELRARGTIKAWYFYYVVNGTERRPKLGEFPAISIDEARRVVGEWKKRVARGEDPSAERQALRHAPTVNDLCDHYLRVYAAKEYKPSTLKAVQSLIRLYVKPQLGKIRVAELTVADVNGLIERIARGDVTIDDECTGEKRKCKPSITNANRVRAYFSKACALAEGASLKWRPRGSNPCRDEETVTFTERKRRVRMEGDEPARMFRALQKMAETHPERVAAILCIAFAGTRVTEMATLKRSAIVVDKQTGEVRALLSEHKTSDETGEHELIIPAPAVKILQTLPAYKNGYVFGPLAEMASPRRAIWDTWNTARENAGVRPNLQPRDLRRTFASAAKTAGASLEAIGELLRHENHETTERYAFLFSDARRELTENTAAEINRQMLAPPKPQQDGVEE